MRPGLVPHRRSVCIAAKNRPTPSSGVVSGLNSRSSVPQTTGDPPLLSEALNAADPVSSYPLQIHAVQGWLPTRFTANLRPRHDASTFHCESG